MKDIGEQKSNKFDWYLEIRFCISFWFIRNEMQDMSS